MSLLIFLLFLISIAPFENSINLERKKILAKEMLMSAAAELDSAVIAGDGYERRLTIPARLRDNTNFTLLADSETQSLMIIWGEGGALGMKVLVSNVSGQFTHGPTVMRNVQGTIVIEEA
nr:hypothetical protein [Candidatus Burarchaeum sp.]